MASDPTVDFPEPKTVGDILERMGTDNAPQDSAQVNIPTVWGLAPLKLGIYAAISMITDDLGAAGIAKERESTGSGDSKFKFRGIDQVYAALNPLLVKHHVIIVPHYRNRELHERKTRSSSSLWDVVVEADFDFICTLDGSKVTVTTIGEAFDSGDKATNKAMSIAYKYAVFITFCVPIAGTDDDPDATTYEGTTSTKQQQPEPQQPQESDEDRRKRLETEARNNYNDAEAWLRACTTVVDLKRTFEESIRWDRIPKGWHPRLVAVEKEMLAQINAATAAPKRGSVAPSFGKIDDDIPF